MRFLPRLVEGDDERRLAIHRHYIALPMDDASDSRFIATQAVLRRLGDRANFGSPRRNGEAVFIRSPRLDAESAPLQRHAQILLGFGLLRVDPDDQDTGRTQII